MIIDHFHVWFESQIKDTCILIDYSKPCTIRSALWNPLVPGLTGYHSKKKIKKIKNPLNLPQIMTKTKLIETTVTVQDEVIVIGEDKIEPELPRGQQAGPFDMFQIAEVIGTLLQVLSNHFKWFWASLGTIEGLQGKFGLFRKHWLTSPAPMCELCVSFYIQIHHFLSLFYPVLYK